MPDNVTDSEQNETPNVTRLAGVTGAAHPAWKKDISQVGAERRVARLRGPVTEQKCRVCGKTARHWVLARVTEHYRFKWDGRLLRQWSVSANDYEPLCREHRQERDPNARG